MTNPDLEYLREAAADPDNIRFNPLPMLRVVLDLAARVEDLERRARAGG